MWPNAKLNGNATRKYSIEPYAYLTAYLFYLPITVPSGVTWTYFINMQSLGI